MWILTNGFENFVPSWHRPLFVGEVRLLNDLTEALDGFACSHESDSWKWRLEESGLFTANSLYILLEKLLV